LLRKIALLATTGALLAGSLMIGRAANAGAPKIDVSHDHVFCDTLYGTIGFAPPLTASAGGNVVTLKGTVNGCTDTDNPAVHIIASSFSGKLTSSGTGFSGLLGISAPQGTLTVKWKTASDSPLQQTSSVLTLGAAPGSVCPNPAFGTAGLNGSGYVEFNLGGGINCGGPTTTPLTASASSAFQGADNGNSSVTQAVTSQSLQVLAGSSAIKSVNLGLGNISIG
jgi:hypothetical protein